MSISISILSPGFTANQTNLKEEQRKALIRAIDHEYRGIMIYLATPLLSGTHLKTKIKIAGKGKENKKFTLYDEKLSLKENQNNLITVLRLGFSESIGYPTIAKILRETGCDTEATYNTFHQWKNFLKDSKNQTIEELQKSLQNVKTSTNNIHR